MEDHVRLHRKSAYGSLRGIPQTQTVNDRCSVDSSLLSRSGTFNYDTIPPKAYGSCRSIPRMSNEAPLVPGTNMATRSWMCHCPANIPVFSEPKPAAKSARPLQDDLSSSDDDVLADISGIDIESAKGQISAELADASAVEYNSSAEYARTAKHHFNRQKYHLALYYYTKASQLSGAEARLHAKRALCHFILGDFDAAIVDCDAAIRCDFRYGKARQRRALALRMLRRFDEAVQELQYALMYGPSKNVQDQLLEAKMCSAILRSKDRRDHYMALGVERNATDQELKTAYRAHCLRWHPDRWSRAHPDLAQQAESNFKEINIAYQVLKDQEMRQRYERWWVASIYDKELPHPIDAPDHVFYKESVPSTSRAPAPPIRPAPTAVPPTTSASTCSPAVSFIPSENLPPPSVQSVIPSTASWSAYLPNNVSTTPTGQSLPMLQANINSMAQNLQRAYPSPAAVAPNALVLSRGQSYRNYTTTSLAASPLYGSYSYPSYSVSPSMYSASSSMALPAGATSKGNAPQARPHYMDYKSLSRISLSNYG